MFLGLKSIHKNDNEYMSYMQHFWCCVFLGDMHHNIIYPFGLSKLLFLQRKSSLTEQISSYRAESYPHLESCI